MDLFCPVPADGRRRHRALAGLAAAVHPGGLPAAQHRRRRARHHAGGLADQLRRPGAVLHQGGVGVRCVRPGRGERVRGPAQPGLPLPADAAVPVRGEVPQGLRGSGLELLPDPAGRAVPAVQRPSGDRVSAFAQQHGDPTGTRSSALNVFIPDALATGRYDLRPESYVRELVVDAGRHGSGPRCTPTPTGETFEQEADVVHPGRRCRRVRPADAAVQIRPLPERPRQRQRPGRPQRHLPRVLASRRAPSTTRSTPGPVAATSAPVRSSSTTTTARAASPAAVTSPAPESASRCRSTGTCPIGRPGVRRPRRSTGSSSTTAWRSRWWCTTCRNTTTGSIWTRRSSTPGVCPSPGSRSPPTRTI